MRKTRDRDQHRRTGDPLIRVCTCIAALALVMLVGNRHGIAQDPASSGGVKRIVVYPLGAPSSELRIYSRPIADALAKRLAAATKAEVTVSDNIGDSERGVDLIVDGSIISSKRGISLEARVRDPASGKKIGAATADVRPLEDLEKSAAELAGRLLPIASSWRRKSAVRETIRLSGSVLEVAGATPASPSKSAPPPLFVVVHAAGNAGGSARVDTDATNAAYAFAQRLGIRYAVHSATGVDEPLDLANAARESGARYALAVYMREVSFSSRGVLSARGSAVVRLVNRDGVVLLKQSVRTDTIVGSRGDRHTALIYSVAEQCLDIALPALRRALARQ